MLMSVLHHKALQKHKERHTHTSHTRPSTQTLTHTEAESLNRDIQDRAIITRQMNTWRQSTLRRGRGNDLWNKEADLGDQVQESAMGPRSTTGLTLENFPGTLRRLAMSL